MRFVRGGIWGLGLWCLLVEDTTVQNSFAPVHVLVHMYQVCTPVYITLYTSSWGVGGGVQNRGGGGWGCTEREGACKTGGGWGGGGGTPKKGVRRVSERIPPTLSGGGVLVYHRSMSRKVD